MAEEDSRIARDNVSQVVDLYDETSGLLPTTNDPVSHWPTHSGSDTSSAKKNQKKSSKHVRPPKALRPVGPTGSRKSLSETMDHRRSSEASDVYKDLPPIPADADLASVPTASSADAVPLKEPYVPSEYQEGETSSSSVLASEGRRRSRSKRSQRKRSTDETPSLDEGSESNSHRNRYTSRKRSTSSSRRILSDVQKENRTGQYAHEQKPPTAPLRYSNTDGSAQGYQVRDEEQGHSEERNREIVARRYSDSQVEKRTRRRKHAEDNANGYQENPNVSNEELTSSGVSQYYRRRRKRSKSRSESHLNENPSRIQENEQEDSEQTQNESRKDGKRRTSRSSRVRNVSSAIVVKSPGNEKELAVDPNDLFSASAAVAPLGSDSLLAETQIGMHRHSAMVSTESLTLTGHQIGGIKTIVYVEDGTRFRKRDQTKFQDEAAAEAAATYVAPPQDLRTHDMQLIAVIHDVEHLVMQILYGFQGLLGGISLALLVLFQLSAPSTRADIQLFLQYYSPLSGAMYKIYSIVSTLALIGALDSSVVRRAIQFGNEYMLTTAVIHAERSVEVNRADSTYHGPVQSESGIVAGIGRGSIRKMGMEAVFGTTGADWISWVRKAKVVVWLRLIASFVAFLSCVLMTHVDARISDSATSSLGGLYGTPGWYASSSAVGSSTVSSDVQEWFALNCTRGVAGVLAWLFGCWESRLQQAVLLASK